MMVYKSLKIAAVRSPNFGRPWYWNVPLRERIYKQAIITFGRTKCQKKTFNFLSSVFQLKDPGRTKIPKQNRPKTTKC